MRFILQPVFNNKDIANGILKILASAEQMCYT